jgi:LmbE family N-acetylglucosaminyl deacetylase
VDLPQGVPTPRQPQALPEEMRSLSPEACHVLEVAAVFGRTFAVDDLAVVLGEAIGQVLETLRETLAADVLVPYESLSEQQGEGHFGHLVGGACVAPKAWPASRRAGSGGSGPPV